MLYEGVLKFRRMMENVNTSDAIKKTEANAGDSSHTDKIHFDDKSESKQVNISPNEKEAQMDHILRDTNCLKDRKINKNTQNNLNVISVIRDTPGIVD